MWPPEVTIAGVRICKYEGGHMIPGCFSSSGGRFSKTSEWKIHKLFQDTILEMNVGDNSFIFDEVETCIKKGGLQMELLLIITWYITSINHWILESIDQDSPKAAFRVACKARSAWSAWSAWSAPKWGIQAINEKGPAFTGKLTSCFLCRFFCQEIRSAAVVFLSLLWCFNSV